MRKRSNLLVFPFVVCGLAAQSTPSHRPRKSQVPRSTTQADSLRLRHGLWEITTITGVRINGMIMLPSTKTSKTCITKDEPPLSLKSNCVPVVNKTGTKTADVSYSCEVQGTKIDGHYKWTAQSDERYTMDGQVIATSSVDNQPIPVGSQQAGRFLSPDCGG